MKTIKGSVRVGTMIGVGVMPAVYLSVLTLLITIGQSLAEFHVGLERVCYPRHQ